MLQLGMIHTNLHLHFSPVFGHALFAKIPQLVRFWNDSFCFFPSAFRHWDPTWWLGLEMVCVTQVARWSLNSMANWPRDSRSPRRRRHVTFFWDGETHRINGESMWIVFGYVWLFFFIPPLEIYDILIHIIWYYEWWTCNHATEIVGYKWLMEMI